MDNAIINKNSIVEDSIIGENVSFSGKIIAKSNIYSNIKDKKIILEQGYFFISAKTLKKYFQHSPSSHNCGLY